MSLSERTFDAISQFPAWLESFDAMQIPGWTVLLAMGAGAIGLVFAIREFLSWFLKTSSIIDEVIRLEMMVRDLQGDLSALESIVERLQTTAGVPLSQISAISPELKSEMTMAATTEAKTETKRQFRLDL
jgi:hypothetical protein